MSSEEHNSVGSPGHVSGNLDHVNHEIKYQESLRFLGDVQRRFEATQPEVYPAFIQALNNYQQAGSRSQEEGERALVDTHETVKILFQGHPDLLERFESSLPTGYFGQRARSEGQI